MVATPLGERTVQARAAEGRVPLREKDAEQVAKADRAPHTDRLVTVHEMRFWDELRLPVHSRNGQPRKSQACAPPAKNQRQPALITHNFSLTAEAVLGRRRARCAQENAFQFLRQRCGSSLVWRVGKEHGPLERCLDVGTLSLSPAR